MRDCLCARVAAVVVVVVVVVLESAAKGASWDSACLSSGLNVTDDRDRRSIFLTSVGTFFPPHHFYGALRGTHTPWWYRRAVCTGGL